MRAMRSWRTLSSDGLLQRRRGFAASVSTFTSKSPFLRTSDEVQEALRTNKPVVALETTIYTHGFPYPDNTTLASHLESVVRDNGGVPATIGVLNGIARVGFTAQELLELTASAGKPETRKLSRRDLGYICGLGVTGRKLNGGTTIAGTMVLAHLAGIKVFATGGLGGVHKGGEISMDISADLTELGRTPVAVISSGCKSFLDIPRTLEYLETQGVCVGTFADGRKGDVDFPAFWTRDSGFKSPLVIRDEREAAAIIHAQSSLGISSGMHFANPIADQHSIPKSQMDAIMAQAVEDAQAASSTGSDNTPFVLARIRELTKGQTVAANTALIEANVVRGTRIAKELIEIEISASQTPNGPSTIFVSEQIPSRATSPIVLENSRSVKSEEIGVRQARIDAFVAGSLAVDLCCDFKPNPAHGILQIPQAQTSNPASITQSLGGVGQNVARAIHYLGPSVQLCSVVGDDIAGSAALQMLSAEGLSPLTVAKKNKARTAQYVAFNNGSKDLLMAMADMSILEDDLSEEFETLWKPALQSSKSRWLVVDANWSSPVLQRWIAAGKSASTKIAFEPVSVAKSQRLFQSTINPNSNLGVVPDHDISLATPNSLELASMHAAAQNAGLFDRDDWWRIIDSMGLSSLGSRDKLVSIAGGPLVDAGAPQQSIQLLPFLPSILTKLGGNGVLMTQILQPGDDRLHSPVHSRYIISRADISNSVIGGVYMRLFPAVEQVSESEIVSVNGVGDTFLGILIAGLIKDNPKPLDDLVNVAQRGSVMTLRNQNAVSSEIRRLRNLI